MELNYLRLISYIYCLGTIKCSHLSSLGVHSLNQKGSGDLIKVFIFKYMQQNQMIVNVAHGEYKSVSLLYAPSEFLSVYEGCDRTGDISIKIQDTYNELLESVRCIAIGKITVTKELKSLYNLLLGVLLRKDCLNMKTKIINTPIKRGGRGSLFEQSLCKILERYHIKYAREMRIKDFACFDKENDADIAMYRFDFYLPSLNILIECDGIQHFQSVKRFGGSPQLRKTRESDKKKNNFALRNNIQLVRLDIRENRSIVSIERNLMQSFVF